ncbi:MULTISPECIES: ABC transporter ATP-binding protein [Microbacterium]|jgi:ABC-type dipeptide/oligopeptide/nickel transport system ATPase component|uniref:ABC transporter ATP-binding protein n=1 Tax=Microbacterium TaxID=33882 RepID=UPI001E65CF09|nr:ABC transporter ATP-binding protein [Microbacterium nymphoidis]MCD2498210.1 ABC transporter ATP-binding protein [Microbacterium nymphoidis]
MTDPILQIRGLNVDIVPPRAERIAILHDVDLTIERGTVMGVVGESGSGKTMLLRALMSILPQRAERRWDTCLVDGVDLTAPRPARPAMAMVFQDPLTSFNPLRRIGGHLREVVRRFTALRGADAERACIAALTDVGIPDPARVMRSYPHELSGGMRQRAMIAMALLAEPELLVADEPTTALDATVQAQILALIHRLQAQRNLSVLIVTHDLGVVAALCDQVTVMKDGAVVETGAVDEVFAAPKHPYTRSLLAASPGAATREEAS